MDKKYIELQKLKRKEAEYGVPFTMTVAYILDKGYEFLREITEEDISEVEGNGLMTQDFIQNLIRYAKNIVDVSEQGVVLVQFCQADDTYDVKFFADKADRKDLEEFAYYTLKETYDEIKRNGEDDPVYEAAWRCGVSEELAETILGVEEDE